ncbi:two-component sensor histidine kinase [Sphingobium sp. TA15]|uniref:histidine kinase n=1 Tax=Sphingobium indicum (strain DSM 16413 / CCM 7287 / MTCC 6362 / UT26 / NBRC 101211 / UT26S) TaxID=452662 RepID=D4Z444_SPHIU|nr:ATP-binding protein [Sphingobium indicum]BAI97376.1 two-component system sensor histidine kinase CpxA [Sphingobium indicum UT26S]BDD66793.1 two-component sensor histidine kinase [Sphingobium sp. TA15]
MTIGSNLSLRLAAILLIGFILLQLLIAVVALPASSDAIPSYGLPRPEEAAAIADALDRAPPAQREALVEAFDGGLYSLRLARALPARWRSSDELEDLARRYRSAARGRAVSVDGRRPRLSRWIGDDVRPARFLAPIRVAIGLREGEILLLTSQPSDELRAYLQGRAMIGALGALALLGVLMLAVRQTTRPLGALSRGVRRFADHLDASDLPVTGPREVRQLAMAFNDMKAQIRALITERTRVLGAIAHDLRTYMTRLRLRAEFIDDAGHRDRAVRDLDEMTALVNDTLFLADRDTAPPTRPERVLLGPTLGEIVDAHIEFGDSVTLLSVPEDLAVTATPLALRRVLDNLIANGLRHGTCVTVAAQAHGAAVDIVVEDDGPGVPAEALSRLGVPFQRFDPSRSRETGGAGLGLAIVRALAGRDRAEVFFEQRAPNGLRVVLRYPRPCS